MMLRWCLTRTYINWCCLDACVMMLRLEINYSCLPRGMIQCCNLLAPLVGFVLQSVVLLRVMLILECVNVVLHILYFFVENFLNCSEIYELCDVQIWKNVLQQWNLNNSLNKWRAYLELPMSYKLFKYYWKMKEIF